MKQLSYSYIFPFLFFVFLILSAPVVKAQQLDCTTPSDCSILVTNESGSATYADTYFGPYSVNQLYTGETFWFCISPIFVHEGLVYYWPSSDWGTCQENGTASFWASPSTNVNIAPWDYAYADITFTSSGSWTIYSSYPGWTCENGECEGTSVSGCSDQIAVTLTAPATPTPTFTPTPTHTPTPTPGCAIGPKTVSLTVSKNNLTSFDAYAFDGKLASGSNLLNPDVDGPNNSDGIGGDDIRCCFAITRSGAVQVINDPALQSIDSQAEFNTLRSYNYKINIVSSITWPVDSDGVAYVSQTGFAERSDAPTLVSYHEYGHTVGLAHTIGTTWYANLMHESGIANHGGDQTTSNQANSF